ILRKPIVTVEFFDIDGDKQQITVDDLFGRAIQHEYDHLNGKTIFDSASISARNQALVDYQIAIANGAKPGQVSNPADA
ncbi:MAG: peptide deformylase, partial [Eggerthellaceae bacterium]|nr:peptide deformylase [Eggerthellaceae bacterium]